MSDAAAGIFISYRRREASYLAGWLHDRLADHFGEPRVFLDIDLIKPGVDFMEVISQAIARSGVLLVIIDPHWLAPDQDEHRRLDKPDDPVRVELETAFCRATRVIPLLLDGTDMPRAEELPDSVARLARLNALRVSYESFHTVVGRLVETIEEELGTAPAPAPGTAEASAPRYPQPWPPIVDRVAPSDLQRDKEQRTRLLSRMSRTYTEYLNQSVEHDSIVKLHLDLDWIPEKTFRPQDQILAVAERPAERLPTGTSLLQAFDKAAGLDGDGLLVVGEPGAGKTTLLFELARQLTERAQDDSGHPLPVYLPLSSWATRRPPLGEWLVDQLIELYQIPRPLGRRWTTDAQLLFVLDGLDEIPDRADRTACVKAINQFNRFGRSYPLPMVVASRPVEYDTLPVKLQLETAVGVRPLDPTVVLGCLQQAGPGLQAVVAAVQRDPELLELLRSPLLVSMLTLTYAGVTAAEIHAPTGTPAERRHQLITDYVNRRFELDQRNAGVPGKQSSTYPPERTRAWLSALALNLTRHQQTVLLLGRMQPDWLPTRWARWAVMSAPGLIFGLIGGLGLGLVSGLDSGLGAGLVAGLGLGLIFGLVGGLTRSLIPVYITPNEGIRRSVRNDLTVALTVGLGAGLGGRLISGLTFGLVVGLFFGLDTAAQYGIFRLLLWRYDIAPLRYVRWLNHTVHLGLLYRHTNGGYEFIHRIIRSYFSEL